jgi:hypothetical protein
VSKRTEIGLLTLAAALVLGLLSYRALDRYIYERGININFKLLAVIAAFMLVVGAALAWFRRRRSR